MDLQKKEKALKKNLANIGNVAIAFSGGVDSTFLLKTALDVLGDDVIAITAQSCSYPEREAGEAIAFCEKEGIRHFVIETKELSIDGFVQNTPDRCYVCKREIFSNIIRVALKEGFSNVAEGFNMDDLDDYRHGFRAIKELGIKSPLQYAQLSKEEVRTLSRRMGLSTWDKPAFACLATRIPYGETITSRKLSMIEQGEQYLFDLGFRQVRVRYHGEIARIETDSDGFGLLTDPTLREKIYSKFKEIGFSYTALDLLGYRTGSLSETMQRMQCKDNTGDAPHFPTT